jgi:hypothetical protein
MGMYGDILNKIDDGQFIKIEPGRPVKLRLLDHPYISQQQFVDKKTGEVSISTRFSWPVWDYGQQRVRILEQGKSVFKQIATASDTWPQGDTMPSPFDLFIKRTGTGQFDTEYTVTAVPTDGTMPNVTAGELPDMAEKSKGGIPIQQVMEGKNVPVVAPKGADLAIEAGSSAPDAPQAKKPKSDDVVPTGDEISEKSKINLDDIPF